ncbi:MAG: hypothetical protein SchgKO_21480 [Schleiferiaceae bacterium]
MPTFNSVLFLVDELWIRSALSMVICLWAFEKGRRDLPTREVLSWISYSILGFVIISLLSRILEVAIYGESEPFVARISGPYALSYWTGIIGNFVVPFILLRRKARTHYGWVLLVVISMSLASSFEFWVLLVTSLHRDYASTSVVENLGILMVPFVTRFFLGLFWVVLMLIGVKVFGKRHKRTSQLAFFSTTTSSTSSANEDESKSITKSKSSEAGEEESSHLD